MSEKLQACDHIVGFDFSVYSGESDLVRASAVPKHLKEWRSECDVHEAMDDWELINHHIQGFSFCPTCGTKLHGVSYSPAKPGKA